MPWSWKRTAVRAVTRGAWRYAAGPSVQAARADTTVLPATWPVDPDWRRVEAGRAARLDHRTTIEVSRPGPWRHVDPRQVDEAWSRPGPTLGLAIWASALGVAWWVGASKGRGPLRALADDRPFTR